MPLHERIIDQPKDTTPAADADIEQSPADPTPSAAVKPAVQKPKSSLADSRGRTGRL